MKTISNVLACIVAAIIAALLVNVLVCLRKERDQSQVIQFCLQEGAKKTRVESLMPVTKDNADLTRQEFVIQVNNCMLDNYK